MHPQPCRLDSIPFVTVSTYNQHANKVVCQTIEVQTLKDEIVTMLKSDFMKTDFDKHFTNIYLNEFISVPKYFFL